MLTLIVCPNLETQCTGKLGEIHYKRGKRIHKVIFIMGEKLKYSCNDEIKDVSLCPTSIANKIIQQAKSLNWV